MTDLPELPLVGDEFAGYRLRAVLGRGGMSVVYQAENPRLGVGVHHNIGFAGSPMNM
jgi:serine/threonine protein kinase